MGRPIRLHASYGHCRAELQQCLIWTCNLASNLAACSAATAALPDRGWLLAGSLGASPCANSALLHQLLMLTYSSTCLAYSSLVLDDAVLLYLTSICCSCQCPADLCAHLPSLHSAESVCGVVCAALLRSPRAHCTSQRSSSAAVL
jgi:hypothetical protein